MKVAVVFVLCLLLFPFSANAQLKLLKDINSFVNQENVPGGPYSFTTIGNTTLFIQLYDGSQRVFKTTGTGATAVTNSSSARSLTSYNGKFWFVGKNSGNQATLWSIGPTSTEATKAITFNFQSVDTLIVHDGNLYAVLSHDLSSRPNVTHSIWKSDGTQAGTSEIKTFNAPGAGGAIRNFTSVGDRIYFAVGDNVLGEKIWFSDGTGAGTNMIDFLPAQVVGPGSYKDFIRDNAGLVYFRSPGHLWRTDNSVGGTFEVFIRNDGRPNETSELTVFKGRLYFGTFDALRTTDGTVAGTVIVKQLQQSSSGWRFSPHAFITYRDSLFFIGPDPIGGTDLWICNGTTAGTKRLTTGNLGIQPRGPLVKHSDSLYFSLDPMGSTHPLAKLHGNSAKIIRSGPDAPSVTGPIHSSPTRIYFAAKLPPQKNSEPWTSQGSSATTVMVEDIGHQGVNSAETYHDGIELNGSFLFGAREQNFSQLWRTDGTSEGTEKIKDVSVWAFGSGLSHFTKNGSTVYFAGNAYDETNTIYRELWKTDGTSGGTLLVKEMSVEDIFVLNSNVYILSDGRLFKTDGTAAGTIEAVPTIPGIFGAPVKTTNDVAFLTGPGNVTPQAVWKTDGTQEGTSIIAGSVEGFDKTAATANMLYFTTPSDKLFVTNGNSLTLLHQFPSNAIHGIEIHDRLDNEILVAAAGEVWYSKGTVANTIVIANGRAEFPHETEATESHLLNGSFYMNFNSSENNFGPELWKTDGSPSGTVVVKDIEPNLQTEEDYLFQNGSAPRLITSYQNRIFFVTGNNGDLWTTQGTPETTVKLWTRTNINITKIYPFENYLLISGSSPEYGNEMFVFDLSGVKQEQFITFNTATSHDYGEIDFQVFATTTSGLPVTFTSSNESVLKLTGNSVKIAGAGNATITAKQPGDGNFNPAADVSVAVVVAKRNVTITLNPISTKVVGGADIDLIVTENSDAPVVFSSSVPTVSFLGNKAKILGAGSTTITASVADDGNNTAASSQVTFCINPLPPVLVPAANYTITSLSPVNTWYKNGVEIVGQTGQQLTVTSTGEYSATVTIGGCTSEYADPISVYINGLEDVPGSGTISPNPATNFVDVKWENGENAVFKLMNSFGQLIQGIPFQKVSNDTYRGDISTLSPGLYLVQIKTSKTSQVRRLIVSR